MKLMELEKFAVANHHLNKGENMSEPVTVMEEFITKLFAIENEQRILSEDRKILIADYKEKLDVKAVQAAIRIAKIKSKLDSSDEELENMVNTVEKNISL